MDTADLSKCQTININPRLSGRLHKRTARRKTSRLYDDGGVSYRFPFFYSFSGFVTNHKSKAHKMVYDEKSHHTHCTQRIKWWKSQMEAVSSGRCNDLTLLWTHFMTQLTERLSHSSTRNGIALNLCECVCVRLPLPDIESNDWCMWHITECNTVQSSSPPSRVAIQPKYTLIFMICVANLDMHHSRGQQKWKSAWNHMMVMVSGGRLEEMSMGEGDPQEKLPIFMSISTEVNLAKMLVRFCVVILFR